MRRICCVASWRDLGRSTSKL